MADPTTVDPAVSVVPTNSNDYPEIDYSAMDAETFDEYATLRGMKGDTAAGIPATYDGAPEIKDAVAPSDNLPLLKADPAGLKVNNTPQNLPQVHQ